jgi:hypothetical protein
MHLVQSCAPNMASRLIDTICAEPPIASAGVHPEALLCPPVPLHALRIRAAQHLPALYVRFGWWSLFCVAFYFLYSMPACAEKEEKRCAPLTCRQLVARCWCIPT